MINMYQKFHRWNDGIKIANRKAYGDVNELRENSIKYYLRTNQEEKAGELIEEAGDVDRAMKLYMKAKQPTKAARLILKTPQFLQNDDMVNQVANYLIKCGRLMFDGCQPWFWVPLSLSINVLCRNVRIGCRFVQEIESK